MEVPESPGTQKVMGVLSRGEDTDGETSDVEVDYPMDSFVSQHDHEGAEADERAAELEVTGEGTAGGPFGLKKVLFVRKKSVDKNLEASKDDHKPPESFKDRVSKLGTGVSERFAALGSIMQEHSKTVGSGASKLDSPFSAETNNISNGQSTETAATTPQGNNHPLSAIGGASNHSHNGPVLPKVALEYFQEYEMTFAAKPEFSVVACPSGKGAMVAWADTCLPDTPAATSMPTGMTDDSHVPASNAVILAVSGESVVDADPAYISGLIIGSTQDAVIDGNPGAITVDGDGTETSPDEAVGERERQDEKVGPTFPVVVRFRERTAPREREDSQGAAVGAGGELFRSRMKAMATGFGNLFQVKETGGSVVRDGSDLADVSPGTAGGTGSTAASASGPSGVFVLTFAAKDGTAQGLPFTMAQMIGGRGAVVSAVREGYASALVQPAEAGVSGAATSAIAEAVKPQAEGDEVARKVEELSPGAVLLRVAGRPVEGKSLDFVETVLEATAAEHLAVKILFRRAPPIYRASVAAELTLEGAKAPHVHVGTWLPLLKRRAGVTIGGAEGESWGTNAGGGGSVIGIGYGGEEWEDVRETMARAQHFIDGFKSAGIRMTVVNMQTLMLPRNMKSAYAGTFEGRPSSFQQAVRLWWSFPDEKTVTLHRDSSGLLGLTPVEVKGGGGAIGSWVIVTAVDGSPCAEAGVPVGENSILTHVNGYDVSPPAYRSLAPLPFGGGEGWAAAVLPVLEGGERGDRLTLTFV